MGRRHRARGAAAGGAEQARSETPGDEDGQEDRVEQEKTDAQANPGADVEMDTQAAAARVEQELAEASGTPMPGVAGGGGGSESDGGEPDPKRRQTLEDLEKEAGIEVPALRREPASEVGSDGIRKKPSTSGFMAKARAKKEAAAAKEKEAAAEQEAAARGGGTGKGHPLGAPVLGNMGPPTPKGKRPMETPPGLRLPEAASYEAGIPSGSDHTAESVGPATRIPQMEGGTGAAAAGPAPGLALPMPGSGAAAATEEMEVEGMEGAAEAAPETVVENRPPVEEPEEELMGDEESDAGGAVGDSVGIDANAGRANR